jgi:hypothetical protein
MRGDLFPMSYVVTSKGYQYRIGLDKIVGRLEEKFILVEGGGMGGTVDSLGRSNRGQGSQNTQSNTTVYSVSTQHVSARHTIFRLARIEY